MAALTPSCASLITSFTPLRLPANEVAQEFDPEGFGLRGADGHAQNLAPAIGGDADRERDRDTDDAAALAHLKIGGVDPEAGPFALDRPGQEGVDPLVDLFAEPADMALGNASTAHGLHEIIHGACRDAVHTGFLDHGGQGLLDGPARLEERRKIGAGPQAENPKLDAAGPRLPVSIAIAVALRQPVGGLLAIIRAGLRAHLELHQALGGKAGHLAQQVGIGALFHQSAQVHHGFGHRGNASV